MRGGEGEVTGVMREREMGGGRATTWRDRVRGESQREKS